VKEIQKVVGCTPDDGVWGPKTTDAVRAWQKAHKLTADGIAGPATLAAMGISDAPPADAGNGITIIKAPIQKHITRLQERKPKYIAIHYTAGSTSRSGQAMATRNVFLTREASADFVVDDAQIVQVNPDPRNYYCWAVGDAKKTQNGGATLYGKATNRNTISIEICSILTKGTSAQMPNHSGWGFTDKALENARQLVRWLMKVYEIPKERVVRHYDISGKLCPGIPGWNNGSLYNPDGTKTDRKSSSLEWLEWWQSI